MEKRLDRREIGAGVHLELEGIRRGFYADTPLLVTAKLLSEISERFGGECQSLSELGVDFSDVHPAELEVEYQFYTRREPFVVAAGIELALRILHGCTGYYDTFGRFINTAADLDVRSVRDGDLLAYGGDSLDFTPAIVVRGRMRDIALAKVPMLGVLARATRIATHQYDLLTAAKGTPILFCAARFDAPWNQPLDGYAHRIAVDRYNLDFDHEVPVNPGTPAHAAGACGIPRGAYSHELLSVYLGDTAELVVTGSALLPLEFPRVALVDFHNDCIGDSLRVMAAMFAKYRQLIDENRDAEAIRFKLGAILTDTSGHLLDKSLKQDPRPEDYGVSPRLVRKMRSAIDNAWQSWDLSEAWRDRAKEWCAEVRIGVMGGFDRERVQAYVAQELPIDFFGIGSNCHRNDAYTKADYSSTVVRVKIEDSWWPMSKAGRHACDSDLLEPIDMTSKPNGNAADRIARPSSFPTSTER